MPGTANCVSGVSTLRRELLSARCQTDTLFQLIAPEALYARPVPDRHRLIFYLGHLEAFDWNLLVIRTDSAGSFHPVFDRLFERGIDPEPGKAADDSPRDWPRRKAVDRYNLQTRAWIDEHLEDADPWVLQMAIEHRHMHAETLAYLLHQLPDNDKMQGVAARSAARPAPVNPLIDVGGGLATMGTTGSNFGWDNEFPAHEVFVPPHQMTRYKISNGEYLDYVRAGGPAPPFWRRTGDQWLFRGMFGEIPLPLDWPAWTTWQQAAGYADWRGLDLPTEAQFLRAAAMSEPDPVRDNFDYRNWDPVAVDHGDDLPLARPSQLTGNGWEWTRDVFTPFHGFEAHPMYPGYSADFFDGEHYVMKGASPRTARMLTRPGFRNWFRPEYPYMYAALRLVRNQ